MSAREVIDTYMTAVEDQDATKLMSACASDAKLYGRSVGPEMGVR